MPTLFSSILMAVGSLVVLWLLVQCALTLRRRHRESHLNGWGDLRRQHRHLVKGLKALDADIYDAPEFVDVHLDRYNDLCLWLREINIALASKPRARADAEAILAVLEIESALSEAGAELDVLRAFVYAELAGFSLTETESDAW